jgi:aconitate hydratase
MTATGMQDPFKARDTLATPHGQWTIHRLDALAKLGAVESLPYCIKVLLESCLRNLDGFVVTEDSVRALAAYDARNVGETEIPFNPGRVVLAGLHRRAGRRGPGRDAFRHRADDR